MYEESDRSRGGLGLVWESAVRRERLHLRDVVTVGRRRSCGVALPWDGQVSRVHCAIVRAGDDWFVEDLESTGGTRVTGCTTPTGPLRPGARIHVGRTELFVVPADSPAFGWLDAALVRRTRAA